MHSIGVRCCRRFQASFHITSEQTYIEPLSMLFKNGASLDGWLGQDFVLTRIAAARSLEETPHPKKAEPFRSLHRTGTQLFKQDSAYLFVYPQCLSFTEEMSVRSQLAFKEDLNLRPLHRDGF